MAERTLDMELRCKDGSAIWAETKVNFLYGPEGKPTGLLGVTRDITEKMRLQQQLFQAQKMESIGALAGGIAHEFNNILLPLILYTDLALEDLPEDSPVRMNLDKVLDLKEDGTFRLDMQYFNYCTGLTMTNKKFADLFGGPERKAESDLTHRALDLESARAA